jgi:hypothetical protein
MSFSEYKDLEARVDALRQAHLALLKFVHFVYILAER